MITDIDGKEIGIGDTILICSTKEYGWLDRYVIVGETKTQFKLKAVDSKSTWPRELNREKMGCNKRALKC